MITHRIKRSSPVIRSARVMQMEGLFDVAPADRSVLEWHVSLPIDERPWNIGLIVGPSGCGKTTIAKEFFKEHYLNGMEWHSDRAVIDEFPSRMSIKDITGLLSSVGFSSPPSWVRPYNVLSNGEQFRATLARALAEQDKLLVYDEFTSVVDRVVGRYGSLAVAKTVRRRGQQFVGVTCHDDVIPWLDPDWVYSPADNSFQWRLLRRRPAIDLTIARVHHSTWELFARHHYLTADHNKAARCFGTFIEGRPMAFHSFLPFVGHQSAVLGSVMRVHRVVVLPDYQGAGIGTKVNSVCASIFVAMGHRVIFATSHPGMIAGAMHDPDWRMVRSPGRNPGREGTFSGDMKRSSNRLTASFQYVGSAMDRKIAERLYNAAP